MGCKKSVEFGWLLSRGRLRPPILRTARFVNSYRRLPKMKGKESLQSAAGLLAILACSLMFTGMALAAGPTEKVVYHFNGGNDGAEPYADLVFDAAGNLYGTTLFGGGGCKYE